MVQLTAVLRTEEHLLPLVSDDLSEVNDTLGVSPLVVVPGNNLNHVVTHDHGEGGVNGGGDVSSLEVHGDEGLVSDGEDTLLLSLLGGTEGSVHLLSGALLLNLDNEVNNGDGRGGDTESDTVELTLEGREDEGNSLGSTSGGGDNVEGGSTGTTEVAVGSIEKTLVTGVRVSGGHGTLDDTELVLNNLDEGGKAVGGAGSVGDDVHGVVVSISVDTADEGGDSVSLGGGGDDNLLGTSGNVLVGTSLVNEDTSSLNDDVNIHLLPGEDRGVTSGNNSDVTAVDGEGVLVDNLDVSVEGTHGGVVLEEVSSLLDTSGSSVDADDLEVGVSTALNATEEHTSDTAETVDGNLALLGHGGLNLGTGGSLGSNGAGDGGDKVLGLGSREAHGGGSLHAGEGLKTVGPGGLGGGSSDLRGGEHVHREESI